MNEQNGDGMDEARVRLADLQTRRHEIEARRAAREEAAALANKIAAEERALADAEALEAAVEKHGPVGKMIAVVETDLGSVIVKRPHHLLFKRFQDAEKVDTDVCDALVRPNVVHPDGAAFDRMLEQQPGTLVRCAKQLAWLAGSRANEAAGK